MTLTSRKLGGERDEGGGGGGRKFPRWGIIVVSLEGSWLMLASPPPLLLPTVVPSPPPPPRQTRNGQSKSDPLVSSLSPPVISSFPSLPRPIPLSLSPMREGEWQERGGGGG